MTYEKEPEKNPSKRTEVGKLHCDGVPGQEPETMSQRTTRVGQSTYLVYEVSVELGLFKILF